MHLHYILLLKSLHQLCVFFVLFFPSLIRNDGVQTYKRINATCSSNDRADIKREMEERLAKKLSKEQTWRKVKRCLANNYGDQERSTYVNEICG